MFSCVHDKVPFMWCVVLSKAASPVGYKAVKRSLYTYTTNDPSSMILANKLFRPRSKGPDLVLPCLFSKDRKLLFCIFIYSGF